MSFLPRDARRKCGTDCRPVSVCLSICPITFVHCNQTFKEIAKVLYYGRTLSERPCYILPLFFMFFLMTALVGQPAEQIFTKLSHVVDIRHHL